MCIACLVVGCKEETKLFPIEFPKIFSTEEIKFIKEVFKRDMNDGFLLWPVISNLNSFMIVHGNGTKWVLNWEQNMLHTKR